jgi:hypothetical protein
LRQAAICASAASKSASALIRAGLHWPSLIISGKASGKGPGSIRRWRYTTPIGGLYACGAGCSPAGGVFALAGHNAAERVLADMELGLERTEVGFKG